MVTRLCAPIEGTDAAHLADCLGLDSSRYRSAPSCAAEAADASLLGCQPYLDSDSLYQVPLCPGMALLSMALLCLLACVHATATMQWMSGLLLRAWESGSHLLSLQGYAGPDLLNTIMLCLGAGDLKLSRRLSNACHSSAAWCTLTSIPA